jgi:hypothetical protein
MRPHTIGTWTLSLLVAVGVLGMPGGAWGQEVGSPTPRMAGTEAEFVLAIHAIAAEAVNATHAARLGNLGFFRFCTDECFLLAPVNLPSGALIIGVELDALDASPDGEVSASLTECFVGQINCQILATAATGVSPEPGPTQVRSNLATPHTVDNRANAYLSFAKTPSGGQVVDRRPWPAASIIATAGWRRKLLSAGCPGHVDGAGRCVRLGALEPTPRWLRAEPRWSTLGVRPIPRAAAGPKVPGSTKWKGQQSVYLALEAPRRGLPACRRIHGACPSARRPGEPSGDRA